MAEPLSSEYMLRKYNKPREEESDRREMSRESTMSLWRPGRIRERHLCTNVMTQGLTSSPAPEKRTIYSQSGWRGDPMTSSPDFSVVEGALRITDHGGS